jgi:hypothetical protein
MVYGYRKCTAATATQMKLKGTCAIRIGYLRPPALRPLCYRSLSYTVQNKRNRKSWTVTSISIAWMQRNKSTVQYFICCHTFARYLLVLCVPGTKLIALKIVRIEQIHYHKATSL